MKISQEEKQKNRERLLQAAVEVITEKGFRHATMREIAKRAGLGEATIYKYFSTKEALIFGYFENLYDKLCDELKHVKDFEKYTFNEQLQTLIETQLELMLGDREFLEHAFKVIFCSTLSSGFKAMAPARAKYLAMIEDLLNAAIEAEEFAEPPMKNMVVALFWDLNVGVLHYWLRDRSESFSNTTQLIHRSLDVANALLSSSVLAKVFELGYFLFKQHVLTMFENLDCSSEKASRPAKPKRPFMATP